MASRQRALLATVIAALLIVGIVLAGQATSRPVETAEDANTNPTVHTAPPGVGPDTGQLIPDPEGEVVVPWDGGPIGQEPGGGEEPGGDGGGGGQQPGGEEQPGGGEQPGGEQPGGGEGGGEQQPGGEGGGGGQAPWEQPEAIPEDSVIAVYDIVDGELEGGPYPEPEPAHVAMWHFARELMPEATVEAMDTFVIFTDGRQNILGAVSPTSSDHSTWSLELDIVDSRYRQEFLHTVVHEISHLLSLEPGQIEDVSPNGQAECGEQLNLVDSCARADSYLQAWGDAFWPDGQPGGSEEFVTDYAMASPEEDFAEHFVEFVLNDPPTGSSVIDEKVQFFYDYDELVEVRGLMRDELDL